MSWFPVDDGAHSHPKFRKAGLAAVGLWTLSGSFCMNYLTDGFVPEWFVKQHPRGLSLAMRLVDAKLWKSGSRGNEKGWVFHDWKPECTKDHVEQARANARARKQKSRESYKDSQDQSRVTGRVTDADRNADVLGLVQPNPTQPNPLTPWVDSGGELTQVSAEPPPCPPPCPRHPNGTETPCGVCKAHRLWLRAQETAREGDQLRMKRRERLRADSCPDCHGTNVIEVGDNAARKCDHPNVELAHA